MYTVGIKRRFFPGYKKVIVNGHSWENFRFLLNLADGSQIVIPGFQAQGIKVYPDFWIHTKMNERQGAIARDIPQQISRRTESLDLETKPELPPQYNKPKAPDEDFPLPQDTVSQEAKRRAAQRVRGILQGFDRDGGETTPNN